MDPRSRCFHSTISGDPTEERFANGVTEDIITDLSRFRDLFVIARNSTAVYKDKASTSVKSGATLASATCSKAACRKTPERVRVTAQLIDATTGSSRLG